MTTPVPEPIPPPERALAVGAHPDDIEFGAGGTLARWADAGTEVTMLVVTDGSKGTWDRSLDPPRLAAIRKDEQLAAAKELGATRVIHLDHIDGELQYSMALRAEVCLQIRLQRPNVLLGHDPWKLYQIHPDHRAAGLAVVDGMIAARDHLFFPEQGLAPHRPDALLLWSAERPDHWEDITGWIDTKAAALLRHSSQLRSTMHLEEGDEGAPHVLAEELKTRAARAGEPAGLAAAEAFKRLEP